MGLLDNVIGALGSQNPGGGGGGQGDLLGAIIGLLGQQGGGGLGGLGGLVQKFEQAGLGDVAKSWVGTGANQPVSPDQLGGVLGNDTIASLAKQLGIDPKDALGQLSQMLPQVVDKLTPQGQIPQGDVGGLGDLGGLLGGLGGLLGKR
ncbi:MAG: DUF937 domain-containing protein [Rubrivivax sp.]|nr:DUF937 domain-containing protein [Rubrivivax sp.]